MWMRDLENGRSELLVSDAYGRFAPRWSPDGRSVAYQRYPIRSGARAEPVTRELAVWDRRTSTETIVCASTDYEYVPHEWTPDGKSIFVSTDVGVSPDYAISTVDVTLPSSCSGLNPLAYTKHHGLWQAHLSSNGRWVALCDTRTTGKGITAIAVMSSAGGDPHDVSDPDKVADK